jgi:hypothetical protein
MRLVKLVHAQVEVVDHPRPIRIFAQLFFQETCLLRRPELGIDEFLVIGQRRMAGNEIVDSSSGWSPGRAGRTNLSSRGSVIPSSSPCSKSRYEI